MVITLSSIFFHKFTENANKRSNKKTIQNISIHKYKNVFFFRLMNIHGWQVILFEIFSMLNKLYLSTKFYVSGHVSMYKTKFNKNSLIKYYITGKSVHNTIDEKTSEISL